MPSDQIEIKFRWKKFPLETSGFVVCIIRDDDSFYNDYNIDNLLTYIKTIFPEVSSDITSKNIELYRKNCESDKSHKNTIVISPSFHEDEWVDNLRVYSNKKDNSFYIIEGKYSDIPKIALTLSDVMFFTSQEVLNLYKIDRFGVSMKFEDERLQNNKNCFYIIDKQNMKDNIRVLPKKYMDRYNEN